MTDDRIDLSRRANLRATFDCWPAGQPLPTTAQEAAHAAIALTTRGLLADRGAMLNVVRFADDGVSLWLLDALEVVTIEDLARGIARAFEPAAFAVAIVQPMKAQGDPTVRGITVRAAFGDDVVVMTGEVTGAGGPPAGRSVPGWSVLRGRAESDSGRWIGVPPTVELELPMLGVAEG